MNIRTTTYFLLLFLSLGQLYGQVNDTTKIYLKTIDTSFFNVGNIHGKLYQFQNDNDSTYLSLNYRIGGWDMGQANCKPTFSFKQNINSGIYLIFVNSRAEQLVEFRFGQLHQLCWVKTNKCCTLPNQKIDTLDGTKQITDYQINTDCKTNILLIHSYKLKNGFPVESHKYDNQGNLEYVVKYKKVLFPNFHIQAKWTKDYYQDGKIIRTEKGKGRIMKG